MKTYYKVLTIEPDAALTSICQIEDVVGVGRERALEYKPGQWTVPTLKGSKLFIFDSFDNAKEFAHKMLSTHAAIWECQVKNPLPMPQISRTRAGYIEDFWETWIEARQKHAPALKAIQRHWTSIFTAPQGTFGASAVKLTKEVYRKPRVAC